MNSWDWKHTVQVRTVSPSISSWVAIQNINYVFTVEPDPPSLTVTEGEASITIDLFTRKPLCVPQSIFLRSLKYFVVMRKKYNPEEVVLEQELDEPTITKKILGYNGEYCVTAKTIYTPDTHKESNFSHPVCLNFNQKDGRYHVVYAALPCSVILCSVIIILVLIWYRITVKSKMPKVLDFSGNRHSQQAPCMPELYSAIYHSLTISSLEEQKLSTRFLNTHDDGVNIYPITGQGYMERPTLATSVFHSREYISSKSSSGSTCPSTSGSVADMLIKAQKNQTDDCLKEININDSREAQMSSSSIAISVNIPLDSLSILGPNSLQNVPLDTLCIGDINDHMDYSDEDSTSQCLTDYEDGLDSLSTNYKPSGSKHPSQEEKAHENWCSGYTQRTLCVK
ncbi:interferon lambda receptor 1 isoform X2 [Eleutherodactylus coqui]